ncbi:MAG: ABC transporter ATP-binding protein, partial [Phycisphaerae bacterium]|nr:ABC transporter ATP-binding protein [Phycisphaerae bacterium]
MKDALLYRLWNHMSNRRRRQFSWLLLLMLVTSLFEVISLGALIPFLAALTNPDHLFQNNWMKPFINFLNISSPTQLLLPLTITFGVAAVLAGFVRLVLLWANTKLSFAAGADLSIDIYKKTLYQPYSVHVSRNSSEVISGITKKTDSVISKSIDPTLKLISSCVMMLAILTTLFYVDPKITICAFFGFGFI